MKKSAVFCVFFFVLISSLAFAEGNKVVVVPLGSSKTAPSGFFMAFGFVLSSGGLRDTYGVTSASLTDVGDYSIILEKSFSAFPIVMATAYANSNSDEIVTWNSSSTGNTINFHIADGAGTPISSDFTFIVYGPTL